MGKQLAPSYISRQATQNPGAQYNIPTKVATESPARSFGQRLPEKPNANPGPGEYIHHDGKNKKSGFS